MEEIVMEYVGRNFTNTTVKLDGNAYRSCTFYNVVLEYSGGNPPTLIGSSFDKCDWRFTGAAARVLHFMQALYLEPGGAEMLDKTFPFISR